MKVLGFALCIPLIASLCIYLFATPAVAQMTGIAPQTVSIAAALVAFALAIIVMMLGKRVAQQEQKK
ncbi:MAG: hypothetical protein KGZ73_14420 [Rhizobiales bacterium]|jgi:membrane protein implicated in regulation of membrane protease activity|nr:hypothetical protein [Hyphomicrobiales bacterium]